MDLGRDPINTGHHGASTGLGTAAAPAPPSRSPVGLATVAFQTNTHTVCPQGFSLTAKGDILAQLRKPRTLAVLVYSTPKPPAQQLKLLGCVALGQRPAGLSRITMRRSVRGRPRA